VTASRSTRAGLPTCDTCGARGGSHRARRPTLITSRSRPASFRRAMPAGRLRDGIYGGDRPHADTLMPPVSYGVRCRYRVSPPTGTGALRRPRFRRFTFILSLRNGICGCAFARQKMGLGCTVSENRYYARQAAASFARETTGLYRSASKRDQAGTNVSLTVSSPTGL
jgi:hypothetical protein